MRAETRSELTGGEILLRMLLGQLPEPTHHLKKGKPIPPLVRMGLRSGQTAIGYDKEGKPEVFLLIDQNGILRQKPYKPEGINYDIVKDGTQDFDKHVGGSDDKHN